MKETRFSKKSMPAPAAPPGESKVRMLALVVLTLAAAAGTWAIFEFVVWNRLPAKMIGKWVVADKGDQEGATFDFYRNGTMLGIVNRDGLADEIHATIRVEGNTLFATTKHPVTRQADTRKQTIITLSDKEFVLQDERGRLMRLERAE